MCHVSPVGGSLLFKLMAFKNLFFCRTIQTTTSDFQNHGSKHHKHYHKGGWLFKYLTEVYDCYTLKRKLSYFQSIGQYFIGDTIMNEGKIRYLTCRWIVSFIKSKWSSQRCRICVCRLVFILRSKANVWLKNHGMLANKAWNFHPFQWKQRHQRQ